MDEAIPLRTFTAKRGQTGLGLTASASQPAITKSFVNFDPRGSNNRSGHEGSPVHLEPAYPGLSSEAEMHLLIASHTQSVDEVFNSVRVTSRFAWYITNKTDVSWVMELTLLH